MAIARERFRRALEELSYEDWAHFERLASVFLATEFPSLRSTASPSGDEGRDSELFSDAGEPATVMQFSVTAKWPQKIRQTINRLETTFPKAVNLIYLTNQIIGSDGDALISEMRKRGRTVLIRDQTWFLDRANSDGAREAAAEALANRFVDPLLATRKIDNSLVTGVDEEDAKTALLFLEMQVQDTSRSLGLTKASYDTLTLAALRDTNTSRRMRKDEVFDKVQSFLPTHPIAQIKMRVEAALKRLEQKSVRHRKDNDEYHLLDAEVARITASAARIDGLRKDFEADLRDTLSATESIVVADAAKFVLAARRAFEIYFLRKGDDFAQTALSASPSHKVDNDTMQSVALEITNKDIGVSGRPPIEILLGCINRLLTNPSVATTAYLGLLLESYTLFAFLAATPDVQKATRSMFAGGEIWLDTSVLLPLLSEAALGEDQRPYTQLFKQVRVAGIKLYVTEGVVEEIERHINRCVTYTRISNWKGYVPFLVSEYILSGKAASTFASWIERFVGTNDPVQDIADYLRIYHDIGVESAADHEHVPEELASLIQNAWRETHFRRRREEDSNLTIRLAAHDAENYLHVLSSRIAQKGKAPLGYSDWWLTFDKLARGIWSDIDPSKRPNISAGPLLSIDYLVRYLAFGPNRDRLDVAGAALGRIYADVLVEPIPAELMSLVSGLREEHAHLPSHIVQRRIRDQLNSERSKLGQIDEGGLVGSKDLLDLAY